MVCCSSGVVLCMNISGDLLANEGKNMLFSHWCLHILAISYLNAMFWLWLISMLHFDYDLLSQLRSSFWLSWLRHYLSFLLFLLSWFLVLQALLFSPILANLLIPNVLECIYEPPISKGYVCVSDISYVCICWFDNPNSKSQKLKYVYYLKHCYVHKWLL